MRLMLRFAPGCRAIIFDHRAAILRGGCTEAGMVMLIAGWLAPDGISAISPPIAPATH